VVLGANPGLVRKVVSNALPRPRDYRAPALQGLVDQLHDLILHSELPDVPAPATPAPPVFEPLPDVTPGEVVGLLEYLDARGGREDVFRIASDTNREFGRVLAVVKAGEMLDLVDTPKRLVVLDRDGERFVKADAAGRQAIWRERLMRVGLFRTVTDVLKREPKHEVDRDFVMETILLNLPQEDYEKVFATFISWARYGNLYVYDEPAQMVSLAQELAGNSS
jgi:NitT/TauT family transport system ATP-binding protein